MPSAFVFGGMWFAAKLAHTTKLAGNQP